MGGQGEDVALVIDDVERYAVVIGKRFATGQTADEPQEGERQVLVRPGDDPYLSHGQGQVAAGAEYFEAMGLQGFGQQMCSCS